MSRELKNALGCFATGVTIITTEVEGQDIGMTCSSFNAVSLDPAMALWNIQKNSGCLDAFKNARGYTVSVLGANQGDIAMRFTHGSQEDRFSKVDKKTRSSQGHVIIPECIAWFDCELHQVIEAGDHYILLSNIIDFNSTDGNALIYERSQFGSLKQLPKVA